MKSKYYEVKIIETTSLMVAVEAENEQEARELAYEKCCDGVLDMGFGRLDIETYTIKEIDKCETQYYSHEVLRKEDDEDETN